MNESLVFSQIYHDYALFFTSYDVPYNPPIDIFSSQKK